MASIGKEMEEFQKRIEEENISGPEQ